MAKYSGPLTISGKLGDHVLTTGKYGKTIRAKPELNESQRLAKAMLPQNQRTALLNNLAAAISKTVHHYAGALKSGNFYSRLGKKFRSEQSNHLSLLLRSLTQLEVHERFQFEVSMPLPKVAVTTSSRIYTANIDILHPPNDSKDDNCFFLEIILMVFNEKAGGHRHLSEKTEWMSIKDNRPKFITVKFKRLAGDTDYILACRLVLGVNNIDDGYMSSSRMRFLEVATLTADGKEAIAQQEREQKAAELLKVKQAVVERPRVKVRLER